MSRYSTPRSKLYKAPKPRMWAIDMPPVNTAELDFLGVYIAIELPPHAPASTPVQIYISRDTGVTYHESIVIEKQVVLGKLLSTGAGGLLVDGGAALAIGRDTASVAYITWHEDYDPTSVTEAELLNGRNYILVGGEIMQFKTATTNSVRSSWLTELIRGRRGTEYNILNIAAAKAPVVVLDSLPFLRLDHADIGKTLYFKCVTNGMSLDDSHISTLTVEGNSIKPFAPANITGTRNASEDVTIEWNRRSRSIVRLMGVKRLPYGEDTDDYEVDVLTPTTPHTVLRTIKATGTSATYTASQQTADGLTLGNAIFLRIYQMSNAVGRGQTNTVSLPASSTPNHKQYANPVTT